MQSPKTKQPLHPVLTVSQLTGQIKDVVEELFDNVYVVGEVSNAKAYPSGHWYFSLKDKDATLPCVCFKSANSGIKFKLQDGLMLVAQGNLSIYPPKGGYQLVASNLEPVGIGEWQLAFEQLRAALEKEGLLDPARKKAIPTVPRRIGVVTSPAAAALRDILSALSRRNRNVNVVISPCRVQGEGSAEEIAQAICDLQTVPGIEVIIVARGGGSIEDLWSFNTDVVARAVAACPIPIVSGVGHETDTTICDLVADLRAPTPTAAAELVAKGSQELFEKYKNLEQKLVFKIDSRVTKARRQLERLSPVNALTRYQGRMKQYQMRVGHYKVSMERSLTHLLKSLQHRWQQKHGQLLALAPTNILNRGFAILRKLDGTVVCDPGNVKPGEELQAILKTGSLYLNVAAVQESLFAMLDPRSNIENEESSECEFTEKSIQTSLFEDVSGGMTEVIEESTIVELTLPAHDDQVIAAASSSDAEIVEPEVAVAPPPEFDAEDITSEELSTAEVIEEVDEEDPSLSSQIVQESLDDDGSSLLVSEALVNAVFDSELADPAVLADIFGENLADIGNASAIFKSGTSTDRVEFDALNAELSKENVPALIPIEKKPEPKNKKQDYSDLVGASTAIDDGALLVEERPAVLELELVVAGLSTKPSVVTGPNARSRSGAKADGARSPVKAAAHQLNLFNRGDED